MIRKIFFIATAIVMVVNLIGFFIFPWVLWSLLLFLPLIVLGFCDVFQTKHAIRRNFPVIGNFRYLFELIRPEINQYFIESNSDGVPFSREDRSLIYQRAKDVLDTLPFGTQKNVYEVGYEWAKHSLAPIHVDPKSLRVKIGGPDCRKPYSMSLLNVSAMSFGALSSNAISALSGGAHLGNFAVNTGEGGVSPYHFEGKGDLVWQIGTGYFGCRESDGSFSEKKFSETANLPQIKMIELKLSQGAKPGHGGILPGSKVTPEIAAIRHVEVGKDVVSPPAHTAFSNPVELLQFIEKLRNASDGKPVGFKLCLGKNYEFLAVCKAMIETKITPDFITVDGGEGGTGAAPLEFSNHLGASLTEGLIFIHNALVGVGLRERIKIISSGKIVTGFGVIKRLALGADLCFSGRAMMMALGCIQALRCNTNACPTGVATQDPNLTAGLVVKDKTERVFRYHEATIESVAEMMGAMGVQKSESLLPWHIVRRVSASEVKHYEELYDYLKPGDLLDDNQPVPPIFRKSWQLASSDSFLPTGAEGPIT